MEATLEVGMAYCGRQEHKKNHLRVSMRRKKNMIKALKNALGVLVEDDTELKNMAKKFYEALYMSEGVHNMDNVLAHVPVKVYQMC